MNFSRRDHRIPISNPYNQGWQDKMSTLRPRYSKEEFARRGDAIYDRDLRPILEPDRNGEFVVIDIETGEYEVDADEMAASDRLLARVPDAQMWLRRVGLKYAHRFGFRAPSKSP
jgi:hypothetical protein